MPGIDEKKKGGVFSRTNQLKKEHDTGRRSSLSSIPASGSVSVSQVDGIAINAASSVTSLEASAQLKKEKQEELQLPLNSVANSGHAEQSGSELVVADQTKPQTAESGEKSVEAGLDSDSSSWGDSLSLAGAYEPNRLPMLDIGDDVFSELDTPKTGNDVTSSSSPQSSRRFTSPASFLGNKSRAEFAPTSQEKNLQQEIIDAFLMLAGINKEAYTADYEIKDSTQYSADQLKAVKIKMDNLIANVKTLSTSSSESKEKEIQDLLQVFNGDVTGILKTNNKALYTFIATVTTAVLTFAACAIAGFNPLAASALLNLAVTVTPNLVGGLVGFFVGHVKDTRNNAPITDFNTEVGKVVTSYNS